MKKLFCGDANLCQCYLQVLVGCYVSVRFLLDFSCAKFYPFISGMAKYLAPCSCNPISEYITKVHSRPY